MEPKVPNEISLIRQAQGGDREAFDGLRAAYQKQIYGFIRARADNDEDAEDIAQEMWVRLWQRMPTYDRARACFQAFVKYWAGIRLLRYYDAKGNRRRAEILFSELAGRFTELEREEELTEVIQRLTAQAVQPAVSEVPSEAYEELLRVTFGGSSPPHQLISFGFGKLVSKWGPEPVSTNASTDSVPERPHTGRAPAKRIAAELSEIPLRELEARLEEAYLEESGLPEHVVCSCSQRLRESMDCRFEEVVKDANTLKTYPHLAGRIVGDTTLRDHYTGAEHPEANIVQWWYAVQRRVLSEVRRQGEGPLFEMMQEKDRRPVARKGRRDRMRKGDRQDG